MRRCRRRPQRAQRVNVPALSRVVAQRWPPWRRQGVRTPQDSQVARSAPTSHNTCSRALAKCAWNPEEPAVSQLRPADEERVEGLTVLQGIRDGPPPASGQRLVELLRTAVVLAASPRALDEPPLGLDRVASAH